MPNNISRDSVLTSMFVGKLPQKMGENRANAPRNPAIFARFPYGSQQAQTLRTCNHRIGAPVKS